MAVDTAQKRFSMINFGDGNTIHMLFQIDGAVDLDDKAHLLDLYSGIALDSPIVGGDIPHLRRHVFQTAVGVFKPGARL